jgi:hypothetical protein
MVKEEYLKPFSIFNVNGKDNWYVLYNDGQKEKVQREDGPSGEEAKTKYDGLKNTSAKILVHDTKVEERDGDTKQIERCLEEVGYN